MAKQVVDIDGENVLMREDEAKMNRGIRWGLLSLALFILVMGALFFLGVFKLAADNSNSSIKQATNATAPASR